MKIGHNIPAMRSHLSSLIAGRNINKNIQNLSSGMRIHSSKDDAAGLAITNKLSFQSGGLQRASRNSMDGVSMVQTAEGALAEVHAMLGRLKELSVQAANDTMNYDDRAKIQMEVKQLLSEIDDTANKTEFNKIKILYGEASRMAISNKQNIAYGTYTSESVPPGVFKFDVASAGVPAKATMTLPTGNNPVGQDGIIRINGYEVEIKATDTANDITGKLQDAADILNMEAYLTGNNINLITKEAGSHQAITITSDNAALLASFGVTSSLGKDAVISNYRFTDKQGNSIGWLNTISLNIVGNRVEVNGPDNVRMLIDLQVKVNNTGNYYFANGVTPITVSNTGAITGGTITGTEIQIRDYGPLVVQLGPSKNQELEISIPKLSASILNLTHTNMQNIHDASIANGRIERAISDVSSIRARLGSYQNRLEYTTRNIDAIYENTELSRSRIQDTDMAREMTMYTRNSVVSQAAMAMIAQYKKRPKQIL